MKSHKIRAQRAVRTRYRLKSLAETGKARMSIFRSEQHIYAQIIDDIKGETLVSASTMDKKLRKNIKKSSTLDAASTVGSELAKRAKAAGVKDVYFDRGGFRYAGRVKALADGARDGGLNF